ncbi:MAG: DUF1295 domain-containing protein [Parasphingorhabdus sp.]|uniref:DUF1295 domain-containing protein n=1 Tax=Parasphingorhabdus sp. TaxID=2709688 RepID=UPI00329A4DE0
MNGKIVIGLCISVALGLLVAIAGSYGGQSWGAMPIFLLCGILAFAINWLAFIPANIAQTEKFYDLTGSITYVTVMLVACLLSAPLDLRSTIVAAMVMIWSLRLGSFLFLRIKADGRDERFDKIKISPPRFFLTWTLQGLWVLFTAASALVIITNAVRLPLDIFAYIGFALWLVGFAIEAIADKQKRTFRKDPQNKGRFIATGLWAWSRHPNYFGEIILWAGITVASLPLLSGWQWVTIISPIFVTILLMKISGVPKLEAAGQKKWGQDPDYIAYCQSVPILVPKPPK